MENYNVVPNIITGKDLDYLSDMFNWNYSGYKEMFNSLDNIKDEGVKKELEKAKKELLNSYNSFLDYLE